MEGNKARKFGGKIKMLKFIIGLVIGANVSLFLYACILAGKKEDKNFIEKGKKIEWRK